jgi:hypothetical protein
MHHSSAPLVWALRYEDVPSTRFDRRICSLEVLSKLAQFWRQKEDHLIIKFQVRDCSRGEERENNSRAPLEEWTRVKRRRFEASAPLTVKSGTTAIY